MKETKGAIMFNGSTKFKTHYIGVYVVSNRIVKYMENGKISEHLEVAGPLVSFSAMNSYENGRDRNKITGNDSVQFNTETHIPHFEDVFHIFEISDHEWAVAQIAENCNLNRLNGDSTS